jgi:hypothetical protein
MEYIINKWFKPFFICYIRFMSLEKEQLVGNIKEWIQNENEIKILQKELKIRKNKKKNLTESLVCVMKKNEIDCFDLSDGKIIYTKSNIRSPLSKKHLIDCLTKYFVSNSNIKPEDVTQFILENRVESVKESIRHKVNK